MDSSPKVPPDEPGMPSLPVPLADDDLPAWWGPVLDSSKRDSEQIGGAAVDFVALSELLGCDLDALRELASTQAPTHRYIVVQRLSVTMWAGVYEAIDMASRKRPTVLKISRRRVELEGSLLATINHPNVVTGHEVFVYAGYPTTVLEWCRQSTLHEYARAYGWRDTLQRAIEAGRGLAHLHTLGLVHADIKPTNILIHEDTGKIGDLGLAGPETLDGPPWGTRSYLPPERERGVFVFAGDVYSFALTIEHSLREHEDVPKSIERVLEGALATDYQRRPTLARLLADLQQELDVDRLERARPELERRREVEQRRRSWLQTAVVLAVLISVGGTVAIAGVCSEPPSTVELNLDLAERAAERGDGTATVQNLELAMRQARLDSDDEALREVASVAESLGHRLIAAGEHVAAGRSWFVARECFWLLGDENGEARMVALFAEHAVPER